KLNEQVQLLSDLASSLLLSDNPREILDSVFDRLSAHLGLEAYFNFLVTEDGSRLRLYNYAGISDGVARKIEWLEYGQAVCGCVARDRQRTIVEDVQRSTDPRTDLIRSLGITAYCCHPLVAHDKMIGTLSFGTRNRTRFEPDEIELMRVVCNLIASSLERARLIARLNDVCSEQGACIRERTAELQLAKQRAELYVDLMGHDINNMNHSAMGYLELALMSLGEDGEITVEGKTMLEKSYQAIQNSSRLIDNVRKLQHLTIGKFETRRVDMRELFGDIGTASLCPDDRDVTINVPDLPHYFVKANELLLDVFLNLISNAIKHSDEAKPLIVDVRVEPAIEKGHAYYRCVVEDNGPGMPDALKSRLFRRFRGGENRAESRGLGLYMVRTLVEGYRGQVSVEDRTPGDWTQGSKIIVMLPAADC
ncbi:MAG TPA: GAF domain-containing sensor histidine kinase, partial [Methanocella sp.]|nr:GAF domain-containing sensor histidine kinase [Methanocella sp.]